MGPDTPATPIESAPPVNSGTPDAGLAPALVAEPAPAPAAEIGQPIAPVTPDAANAAPVEEAAVQGADPGSPAIEPVPADQLGVAHVEEPPTPAPQAEPVAPADIQSKQPGAGPLTGDQVDNLTQPWGVAVVDRQAPKNPFQPSTKVDDAMSQLESVEPSPTEGSTSAPLFGAEDGREKSTEVPPASTLPTEPAIGQTEEMIKAEHDAAVEAQAIVDQSTSEPVVEAPAVPAEVQSAAPEQAPVANTTLADQLETPIGPNTGGSPETSAVAPTAEPAAVPADTTQAVEGVPPAITKPPSLISRLLNAIPGYK